MEIITGTTDFLLNRDTAVAIGKFDGVHIGHRRLLEEITDKKKDGLLSCVFTFDPSPAVFFAGEGYGAEDIPELNTREEKRILLERAGIDILVEFPLNRDTAAIPAEKFITEVLWNRMNVRFVAAGKDLSFGAGGRGDAFLLTRLGQELGIGVQTIEKVSVEEGEVSSTMIRSFVERGEMDIAEKCLGIPYPVIGRVAHGRHIGHTLGVPTVNLNPDKRKILPPNGVYASDVVFRGKKYRGISNVGVNPTVTSKKVMGIETYIYDFDEEIYDEEIEVYLKKFQRPEKKFGSLEELKAQLRRDIGL